jgi:hypothetical protein
MSSVVISGDTSGAITLSAPAIAGTNTLSLPAVTDTLVGLAATQTLTNKSIAATQLTGTIAAARLPTGSVLQVASTLKQDTFTTSSTSYTDVTGLSVSITPTSATSKILVTAVVSLANTNTSGYNTRGAILRDSTIIGAGTPSGNRPAGSFFLQSFTTRNVTPISMTVLDSPATTSATTYKVQIATESGGTAAVGRVYDDSDSASVPRLACSITVMEIAA